MIAKRVSQFFSFLFYLFKKKNIKIYESTAASARCINFISKAIGDDLRVHYNIWTFQRMKSFSYYYTSSVVYSIRNKNGNGAHRKCFIILKLIAFGFFFFLYFIGDDPMVNIVEWKMQQKFCFFFIHFYLKKNISLSPSLSLSFLWGILNLNINFFCCLLNKWFFCSPIPCVWFTNRNEI